MDVATDPLGRRVQLTEERWSDIIEGHPYMAPFRADVMRAIEEPTHRIEQPLRLFRNYPTRAVTTTAAVLDRIRRPSRSCSAKYSPWSS
jgi:hypothetical protein